MIDWPNLKPLKCNSLKDFRDRERLAQNSYKRKCAKHCGRNHLSNQKRRHLAKKKAQSAATKIQIKNSRYQNYKKDVRAYWLGLLGEHASGHFKQETPE